MRVSKDRDGAGQDSSADSLRAPSGLQRVGSCKEGCGACCKGIALNANPAYFEQKEVKRWLELHGIRVWQNGGQTWCWVPVPCSELQPDMKCGLYGKPERPKLCEDWPFNQQEIITLREVTGAERSYSFAEPE